MKIGIAGAGMIVRTLLETLGHVDGITCEAVCVREQSLQKGEGLAEEFNIPNVYTDYQKLLSDTGVDFIYIGLPNQLHYEYAREALAVGKNVILEKPFTTSADEAEALVKLAEKRKLFLFEAITSLHMPMFKLMKKRLHELGEIKLARANYSQYSSRYERYLNGDIFPSFRPECFGGALYDLNNYNLHILASLFGTPKSAAYHANRGHNGVDTSGVALLIYDGFIAECAAAKDSDSPCFFTVQGTKGYASITGKPNECPALEIEAGGKRESFSDPESEMRMIPEFLEFKSIWESGDFNKCMDYMRHSVNVMTTFDMLRQDSGGISL